VACVPPLLRKRCAVTGLSGGSDRWRRRRLLAAAPSPVYVVAPASNGYSAASESRCMQPHARNAAWPDTWVSAHRCTSAMASEQTFL
jgi:hypothetical protein